MLGMASKYSEEFREDVVRLVHDGMKVAQVSEDMGVSVATVYEWCRRLDIEEGRKPGLKTDEREELRALKKRNRELEQENEILRRASAYLSQANLPGKGSSR